MNKEEDVFVKPDEQNKACLGSAMVGKDLHKMEHFFLHSNEVNHINREDYVTIALYRYHYPKIIIRPWF